MNNRVLGFLTLVFVLGTGYIAAFSTASIFYFANVVVHVFLGLALTIAASVMARQQRVVSTPARGGLLTLGVSAAMGVLLAVVGATRPHQWILVLHIALGAVALIIAMWVFGSWKALRYAVAAMLLLQFFRYADRPEPIRNASTVPLSMEEEGAGPGSPFWPSSSNTNVNGVIPADFFMDSKRCGECHKDIYQQWNSSMHHFASFNNQFYRKSIEHMQEVVGTKPSKWCAGCHDHAVFFNGRFDRPIKEQIDTPEAQNGLGCMSCHSITHVSGTTGNGGFTMEYPPLHELASSSNPLIRKADDYLTYLNPRPHRKTFLKPFMESAEFCSACHKVHLDVPVNGYRWVRGFNDYDNWQASGVSGQGARSFYYPPKSSTCADCHMPMVKSDDPGNRGGVVHSHRFPAANTAVAYVNRDEAQMAETVKFLKSGFITVDLFAVSPVDETSGATEMRRRTQESPGLNSTFAVGEESDQTGVAVIREVGKVLAPLEEARLLPGKTVRVDAVVRTRKIGHFFPGGTVDAFDVWLELQARDATGRIVFWSGKVDGDGRGAVETGAHFYRSYQLDANGNTINKRNAFQTRSTLYVRLIPPGAADVAHYRVSIPKDAKGPVTLSAKLNYRKFSHYYTRYAYETSPDVSGEIKSVPDLPIITVAESKTQVSLGEPSWQARVKKKDRERWNDWGIGLLLQGDLKGAEFAFRKVTEAEPEYADGWLNAARTLIQEGETEAAKPFISRALALNQSLGRIHFFKAMIEKADGDYAAAAASLQIVAGQYPRDRVVLNQIGRVLFLQRKYSEAVEALQRTLSVDPEDVQAHYTLMLVYRGLGQMDRATREERLFARFKADESSQALTAKTRMVSAEDNNERQAIHDHESVLIK